MILTTLKHLKRYEPLHPLFAKAIISLKTMDFLNLEPGRYQIQGEELFINNVATQGVPADKQPLEMHRAYIDIHVLLEGHERIAYKATDQIQNYTQVYKKDGDCALSNDTPTSYVDMLAGDVCIVYPEDAHAPLIGSGDIRKLIIKVKL